MVFKVGQPKTKANCYGTLLFESLVGAGEMNWVEKYRGPLHSIITKSEVNPTGRMRGTDNHVADLTQYTCQASKDVCSTVLAGLNWHEPQGLPHNFVDFVLFGS